MTSPISDQGTPAPLVGPQTEKDFQDIFEDLWRDLVLSDWENKIFHAITKWLLKENLDFLSDRNKFYLEIDINTLPSQLKDAILGRGLTAADGLSRDLTAADGYPTQVHRLFNKIVNSTRIVLAENDEKNRYVTFYNCNPIHLEELYYWIGETKSISAWVTQVLPPDLLLEEARWVCRECKYGAGTKIDNQDFPYIFNENPVISTPKIGPYTRTIRDRSAHTCKNCKQQNVYELIHNR